MKAKKGQFVAIKLFETQCLYSNVENLSMQLGSTDTYGSFICQLLNLITVPLVNFYAQSNIFQNLLNILDDSAFANFLF